MNLAPVLVAKFFDNDGKPLAGGKLFSYLAGTTTKTPTYSNSTGAQNTNPVILNFRGEAFVWIDPTLAYKFVLAPSTDTDPPTNPFWTVDAVNSGVPVTASSVTIVGTTPTLTFNETDGPANQQLYRFLTDGGMLQGQMVNTSGTGTPWLKVSGSSGVANQVVIKSSRVSINVDNTQASPGASLQVQCPAGTGSTEFTSFKLVNPDGLASLGAEFFMGVDEGGNLRSYGYFHYMQQTTGNLTWKARRNNNDFQFLYVKNSTQQLGFGGGTSPGTLNSVQINGITAHVTDIGLSAGVAYLAVDCAGDAGVFFNDSSQAVDSRLWSVTAHASNLVVYKWTDAVASTVISSWQRDGKFVHTGGVGVFSGGGGGASGLGISLARAGQSGVFFHQTDGTANENKWDALVTSGSWLLRLVNTAESGAVNAIEIKRGGTGTTINSFLLNSVEMLPFAGSATYDPPNLADGAGATTTVTATGCALGDCAMRSFSLDTQGIILSADVTAANTVSVRFQNETGGAIDLGSGTLRVKTFKG